MHEQGCEKVHARDQWDQINGQGEVWGLTGGGWALMRAAVHSLEEPSSTPKMDAFLWEKKALHSRFEKLKGQDASKEPQQTCSRSISAVFVSSSSR